MQNQDEIQGQDKIKIHNTHIHTFTGRATPENFLPLGFVRFLSRRKYKFIQRLARFLNNLHPESNNDIFDRYAKFIRIGGCESQELIFRHILQFYPEDSVYAILSVDLAFMGAGKVPEDYKKQLDDLAMLRNIENGKFKEQILPFICIDPRRTKIGNKEIKNVKELAVDYIENKGFHGIKLYPPIGYFPYDERLHDLYDYAQDNAIPITAHSSRGGPIYYRGGRRKLKDLLSVGNDDMKAKYPELKIDPKEFKGKKNQELCGHFTHPRNYKFLLKEFPKLKICLAHFGGKSDWDLFLDPSQEAICVPKELEEKDWFTQIYDILKEYPTIYADISFTLSDKKYLSLLKVALQNPKVRNKILFGSDYYVVQVELSERNFSVDLRGYLGENDYRQIAETNPKVFLFS